LTTESVGERGLQVVVYLDDVDGGWEGALVVRSSEDCYVVVGADELLEERCADISAGSCEGDFGGGHDFDDWIGLAGKA
jgi:hypothetical protein